MRQIFLRLQEKRMEKKSLYVHRPLVNSEEFLAWAKEQGFSKTTEPDDLHATILYSVKPVLWSNFSPSQEQLVVSGGKRMVSPLGDEGAVVVKFVSPDLQARHKEFRDGGGHHGYSSYKPHVTITYDGQGVDLSKVEPFGGDLVFGPEKFSVIDKEWKPNES